MPQTAEAKNTKKWAENDDLKANDRWRAIQMESRLTGCLLRLTGHPQT
jgi:hypothetical protein